MKGGSNPTEMESLKGTAVEEERKWSTSRWSLLSHCPREEHPWCEVPYRDSCCLPCSPVRRGNLFDSLHQSWWQNRHSKTKTDKDRNLFLSLNKSSLSSTLPVLVCLTGTSLSHLLDLRLVPIPLRSPKFLHIWASRLEQWSLGCFTVASGSPGAAAFQLVHQRAL